MKYILCYGDSNTWGCIPETVDRYDFSVRWPGVVQGILGGGCHIYENALNGRTTVFDDPIEEGRCGKIGFPVVLESNAPLDLVIVMLGTNDTKNRFHQKPWDIALGMDLLVKYVQRSGCGRNGGCPRILVVSPPEMGDEWERTRLGTVFGEESKRRADQLAPLYRQIAEAAGVDFFDAAPHARGDIDSVHLSPETHRRLGEALAAKIGEILSL